MKKLINIILWPIIISKKFFIKYNITFNYYFISIALFLTFTFIITTIVGDNILKHEAYVFKKEFIKKNEENTLEAADKVRKYFEQLDTLAIVDLIENLGKDDNVVYAYILNNNCEVIAHTIKKEMYNKYEDKNIAKFVDKKHLKYFLKNIKKVWHYDEEFKGREVIRFSRPMVLQFTKDDIIKELTISDTGLRGDADIKVAANSNTEAGSLSNEKRIKKEKDDKYKKFYIAGALHTAYSTEELQRLSAFSGKKVLIFYCIAYLLAIIFGYFIGKHLEDSIDKLNTALNALKEDEKVDTFNTKKRIDTFKKLQININQLIEKDKEGRADPKINISLAKPHEVVKEKTDKKLKIKKDEEKDDKKDISSRLRRI